MLTFTEALGDALYHSLAFSGLMVVPTLLAAALLWSRPVARLRTLLGLWATYAILSAYVGTRIFLEGEYYPAVYLLVSLHPFSVVVWLSSRLRRRGGNAIGNG